MLADGSLAITNCGGNAIGLTTRRDGGAVRPLRKNQSETLRREALPATVYLVQKVDTLVWLHPVCIHSDPQAVSGQPQTNTLTDTTRKRNTPEDTRVSAQQRAAYRGPAEEAQEAGGAGAEEPGRGAESESPPVSRASPPTSRGGSHAEKRKREGDTSGEGPALAKRAGARAVEVGAWRARESGTMAEGAHAEAEEVEIPEGAGVERPAWPAGTLASG